MESGLLPVGAKDDAGAGFLREIATLGADGARGPLLIIFDGDVGDLSLKSRLVLTELRGRPSETTFWICFLDARQPPWG